MKSITIELTKEDLESALEYWLAEVKGICLPSIGGELVVSEYQHAASAIAQVWVTWKERKEDEES